MNNHLSLQRLTPTFSSFRGGICSGRVGKGKKEAPPISFSVGVRELQDDGDVDSEDLIFTFAHHDHRVLLLWMDEITKAKDQEQEDMRSWKGKKLRAYQDGDLDQDFDDDDGIRKHTGVARGDQNLSLGL